MFCQGRSRANRRVLGGVADGATSRNNRPSTTTPRTAVTTQGTKPATRREPLAFLCDGAASPCNAASNSSRMSPASRCRRPGSFARQRRRTLVRASGIWVYPGFPTIFRGLSEFFVGDLMGKALWKLVENAQRFPRRGGRVLCVHGPVSFHRARPCATKWPPLRGLRTGPPASSDCGRP